MAYKDRTTLTERERQVLRLAVRMSNKRIAHELGIGERTVDRHLDNINLCLGSHGRFDAAVRAGIVIIT